MKCSNCLRCEEIGPDQESNPQNANSILKLTFVHICFSNDLDCSLVDETRLLTLSSCTENQGNKINKTKSTITMLC